MHLIQLTYQASCLSLAYLKHAQNTYISLPVAQNHLVQSLFYNKVLSMSCNLMSTVLNDCVDMEWL